MADRTLKACLMGREALEDHRILAKLARVAVEQGSTIGWERYVGPRGHVVGMKTFGASAPLKALQTKFGFEPERVAAVAKDLLRVN